MSRKWRLTIRKTEAKCLEKVTVEEAMNMYDAGYDVICEDGKIAHFESNEISISVIHDPEPVAEQTMMSATA